MKIFKHFKLASAFLLLGWGAWAENPGGTYVRANPHAPVYDNVEGLAVRVTPDGFIELQVGEDSTTDILRLRPWAMEVEPDALGMIVLGRTLQCMVIYRNEDHAAGRCSLSWEPEHSGCDTNVFCTNSYGLNGALEHFAGARSRCSDLDYENLSLTISHREGGASHREACERYEREISND